MRDTAETRRKRTWSDRQARWYDFAEQPLEVFALDGLRRRLWSGVKGMRILEIGVGTGRNLPYYPPGTRVVALDLSEGMLRRAAMKAIRAESPIDFLVADTQHLPFKDGAFDTALATFVFCSVPDPVRGLTEAARVTAADGRVVLLEHVRPENAILGRLADLVNHLWARMGVDNINRDTAANMRSAGMELLREEKYRLSIVRLLHARPGL